jgi:hypothetical protein
MTVDGYHSFTYHVNRGTRYCPINFLRQIPVITENSELMSQRNDVHDERRRNRRIKMKRGEEGRNDRIQERRVHARTHARTRTLQFSSKNEKSFEMQTAGIN